MLLKYATHFNEGTYGRLGTEAGWAHVGAWAIKAPGQIGRLGK